MSYEKDTLAVSLIWGRIGAAVMALAAFMLGLFGYAFSPEEQVTGVQLVSGACALVAGALALVSKVRESKKVKE